MNLRATHHGYAYQDLITGIALVDLMLGTAESVTVDTKGFTGDRFDDLTIGYRTGRRNPAPDERAAIVAALGLTADDPHPTDAP